MLRYLRGMHDHCIIFSGCGDSVCGYVNSYYVGDLDEEIGQEEYVFTLIGGVISWLSKL